MRKRLQIFCLLLLPCLALMGILGRGSPAALSASSDAAIPASADNWGLSFPAEHEPPIGNATADFLAQYNAWYVGDTDQKVIYLTFDCGYENGNTEAILDALKAVAIPAVEVHISDVDSREPFRQVSYAGMACIKTYKGLGFDGYVEAVRFLKSYLTAEK